MKKSAKQVAVENLELCKTLTANEIRDMFPSIFSSTISERNFVDVLQKNGIKYRDMSFIENSIEFDVIDKYDNEENEIPHKKVRVPNNFLASDATLKGFFGSYFYPLCTIVNLKENKIYSVRCKYSAMGYSQTPDLQIIK